MTTVVAGSGQELYDRWCANLAHGWHIERSIFTTNAAAGQPSSPPVQWSFLTAREREAWDGLASEVAAAIAAQANSL